MLRGVMELLRMIDVKNVTIRDGFLDRKVMSEQKKEDERENESGRARKERTAIHPT